MFSRKKNNGEAFTAYDSRCIFKILCCPLSFPSSYVHLGYPNETLTKLFTVVWACYSGHCTPPHPPHAYTLWVMFYLKWLSCFSYASGQPANVLPDLLGKLCYSVLFGSSSVYSKRDESLAETSELLSVQARNWHTFSCPYFILKYSPRPKEKPI